MNDALAVFVIPNPGPATGGPTLDVTGALAPVALALGLIVALSVVTFLLAATRRPRRRHSRRTYAWTPRPVARGMAVLVLALLASGATAHAQGVADGLQCHRVTDAERKRLKAVVDLDAPAAGLAPGCRLSRAKLYCTPTKARVQPGTLLDGNTPLAELPYHGRPADTDRICYEVTCPAAPTVTETVTDRFGTRAIKRSTTEMLCTPATGGTTPPPANGFQITSPATDIYPLQNISYCYYFRTPNTATAAVRRFVAELPPGVKSVAMYTTTTSSGLSVDRYPAGTLTAANCNMFANDGLVPRWIFAADQGSPETELPADDGAGRPVALEIPPNQSAFLMIHHHNTTDQPVSMRVKVTAEALDTPVYTTTDSYTTYTGDIVIPPYMANYSKGYSCALPSGVQFWRWSTRTHARAKRSFVADHGSVLYENLDWAHPGAETWMTPPFLTFGATHVNYGCTWDNPFPFTLRTGDSQQTDEQCMATGYFFPSTRPYVCHNGYVFP